MYYIYIYIYSLSLTRKHIKSKDHALLISNFMTLNAVSA